MKKCPFCAEEIQDDAVLCRFCGQFLARNAKVPWYPPARLDHDRCTLRRPARHSALLASPELEPPEKADLDRRASFS